MTFKRLVLLNGKCDKLGRWGTGDIYLVKQGLTASSKSLFGL